MCLFDICMSILSTEISAQVFCIFPIKFKKNLFIIDCAGSSSLPGLSVVVASRGIFQCGMQASHCGVFSFWRAWALECKFSSYGTWTFLPHDMWDHPGPCIKPVSPALAGGFLSTAPPGKSYIF